MTDEQKARDIIAGIHADLASRGDPGTPYRSVREVYEAKAAAEAGTPIETKQIPGTTGTGRMRTTDPLTGKQYGVTREMLKAYGVQKDGIFTGEMDWKSIHRDAATASFWKAAEAGQINTYDDIKPLAAQYNNSAPAGNALKAQFDDYWNLPAMARNILIGTVDYEGKKGIEGLNAWFENEKQAGQETQTRRDLAKQTLGPALNEDGSIDIKKLGNLINDNPKQEKAILKALYAAGYQKKDPIKIVEAAKQVPKYERDPSSLKEHLQKGIYQEGPMGVALDFVPVIGTMRLKERYMRDGNVEAGELGWIMGSAALDLLALAPATKVLSGSKAKGANIQSVARSEAEKYVNALRETGRYSDDLLDAIGKHTENQIVHAMALQKVDDAAKAVIKSADKAKVQKQAGTAVDVVSDEKAMVKATSEGRQIGHPETSLVKQDVQTIKANQGKLDQALTELSKIEDDLTQSSKQLQKQIESASEAYKTETIPKGPAKTTALVEYGDRIKSGGYQVFKNPDIVLDDPKIIEQVRKLLDDPTMLSRNLYETIAISEYGDKVSNITKQLDKLKSIYRSDKWDALPGKTQSVIKDEIARLETFQTELQVGKAGIKQSGKIPQYYPDGTGKLIQDIAKLDQKIPKLKGAAKQKAQAKRDELFNDLNKAMTEGMQEIYKAGSKAKVKGIDIPVAGSDINTVNLLTSKKLLNVFPGLKRLPQGEMSVQKMLKAADTGDVKLLKEAASELKAAAKSLPAEESKLIGKWTSYIDRNAESLADMIRTSLKEKKIPTVKTYNDDIRRLNSQLNRMSTGSAEAKRLEQMVNQTRKQVKVLEKNPLQELFDRSIARAGMPAVATKAALNVISASDLARMPKTTVREIASVSPFFMGSVISEATPKQREAILAMLSPDLREQVEGQPAPSPAPTPSPQPEGYKQPDPTEEPSPEPAPSPAPTPSPQPEPSPEPSPSPKPGEKPGTSGRPTLPKKSGTIPSKDESKTKDEKPEQEAIAPVAFRMGEVTKDGKREDVYVVAHDDGRVKDQGIGGVRIVIGDPPAGVPKKGSPQETLTVLGKGIPPEELIVNIGNQQAKIKRGQRITFVKRKSRQQPTGRIAQRTKSNGTMKRGRKGRRTPGVIGN